MPATSSRGGGHAAQDPLSGEEHPSSPTRAPIGPPNPITPEAQLQAGLHCSLRKAAAVLKLRRGRDKPGLAT